MAGDIEQVLLQRLAEQGAIADSGVFASELQEDHLKVVGVIKSLEMADMITVKVSVFFEEGRWGRRGKCVEWDLVEWEWSGSVSPSSKLWGSDPQLLATSSSNSNKNNAVSCLCPCPLSAPSSSPGPQPLQVRADPRGRGLPDSRLTRGTAVCGSAPRRGPRPGSSQGLTAARGV